MMPEVESLRREKEAIEARHGPWTAHNVRLAEGLYTIAPEPTGDEVKLRRIVQLVSDMHGGRLSDLRVLDLACLEGMYAIEFATRGAQVVAIEGREANLAKAQFAARALGLDRVEFVHGDVRDLSRERHGSFDVVLCLGILYHLDTPDVFSFVERMAEVCDSTLVVDTHLALGGRETRTHGENVYHGFTLHEHDPDASEEERLDALWSSLDNPSAYVFTRPSLLALLARSGFTTLLECHVPAEPGKQADRITIAGLKGEPQTPLTVPAPATAPEDVPEGGAPAAKLASARTAARVLVPRRLRPMLRRLAGLPERRY